MPVKTVEGLPSAQKIVQEGITFVTNRSDFQSKNRVSVVIINLMSTKKVTEEQFLKVLGHTPLQVDIEFVYMTSHRSKSVSKEYLETYYKTFEDIKDQYFDGLIVTGAPVEQKSFNEVTYIDELKQIIQWSESHVSKRLFVCWGAQFILSEYYGINRSTFKNKLFGIYPYEVKKFSNPYMKGFNDIYNVPQSRHTQLDTKQLKNTDELTILSSHPDFGPDILTTSDSKDLFIIGHLEYDREALDKEYKRDLNLGLRIEIPANYYPLDNPSATPLLTWKSFGLIFYGNWIYELYKSKLNNCSDGFCKDR